VLTLRATTVADLDFVAAVEADDDTQRWLAETSRAWHRAAMRDSDQEHLLVVHRGRPVGFAVLVGLTDRNRNIELRRIAIDAARRGRGLGRLALRAVVARALDAGAHRVWLDVKEANRRAQSLYASEGFVREGLLRESLLEGDGSWSSLIVMSLLEEEHARSA